MQVAIITLINKVIAAVGVVITAILMLLPDSPFLWMESLDSTVLSAINYIIPIPAIVSHLQVYVLAVALYYAIRIALRWAKAAGG